MSITRDTPLGTLHIADDPVDGGDVVDFPQRTDDADSLAAARARHAAANARLLQAATANYANPPTTDAEAYARISDALAVPVAHLAEHRRPTPRPNLTVHTGGAA